MAELIETVSFDVDASGATKQVDSYIKTLQSLEREMVELQKAGKDTSLTQQKIAATTAQLNKVLTAETVTMKGATAQAAAYDKTQKQLNSTTQKMIQQTDNLTKSTARQNASFGRSLAGAKNLTQAFTRGAAGLTNLVGGFGIANIGINLLSDGVAKLIDSLFKASLAQESVDNATKSYTETVAKETAALQVNFAALNNTNLSLSQRKEALGKLIAQFPEYFAGLDAEKSTVEALKLAYEGTAIAIKSKALESAFGGEREALTSKKIQAEIEKERLVRELAIKQIKANGQAVTEEGIAYAKNRVLAGSGISLYDFGAIKEYQASIAEINAALKELDNIQKDLTKSTISEEDKITEQKAKRAAKLREDTKRIEDINKKNAQKRIDAADKTEADAAKKAAARREKEADDRAKARKATADEAAENERLKGTLAGLQKELGKINELLTSGVKVTDKERLAELGAEYQRVTKDIENAQAAIDAVTKARKADEVQIIENAKIGNIETELLRNKIADNQKLAEQLEIQRQRELNLIEASRQKNLAAVKDETARNIITAAAAKEREAFEAQSAENILRLRIKLQKQKLELAAREKQDTTEIANEVLKLEAELLELTGKQYDIKVGVDGKSVKDTKEQLKEVVNQVADVVEELSGQVFDFISSQNAAALAESEAAISKQQEILNGLLANEEQTNTEQIRLEQERLDKLNEAREKAKENEAKIAQAQIAINLALAVARAVAEGGGVASAITVGLALTAAIFGFLKAKQTAEQAFFEGTLYAERAPGEPAGRDTIHARINEGEAIIPTETNRQYSKAIEAIYYKKIPAKTLNAMVGDYLSGANAARENVQNAANANRREFGIVSLSRQLAQPTQATNNGNGNDTRLVAELIVSELRKLPQQQIKGSDIVTALQSKADAKGKVRKRLGVQK